MASVARSRDTPPMIDQPLVRGEEITVPRTARYAVLGADASVADEIWLVCHGYGQLASRFIRRFGVLDNGRRLIVAPEGLSRFYLSGGTRPHSDEDKVGASWMTREGRDAEIADQVTFLDMVLERAAGGLLRAGVRVIGLGFSQGAATICRWAARTAMPPDQLVLWGSGVPADLLTGEGRERLVRAALTIVVGSRDPVADDRRLAAHRKQLDAARLSYRLVTFDGGHEMDGAVLHDIARQLAATR
jgi:predicted esterase